MTDEIRLPEPEMACWPSNECMERWREQKRRRRVVFRWCVVALVAFAGLLAWLVLP